MTNHWVDIKNADLVLIMGGNAAEAHPCGFKWVVKAKAQRGAKLVVVDPRFTRSAAVADAWQVWLAAIGAAAAGTPNRPDSIATSPNSTNLRQIQSMRPGLAEWA